MSSDSATDDPKPDHANICVLLLGRRCGMLHGVGSSAISLTGKTATGNAEIYGTFYVGDRAYGQSNQNEHIRVTDAALAPEARHVYSFR